jgi:hypothetical protein
MVRPASLLARLKHIPEREFENLVYDLAVACGLQNVSWRTPGPDAGRDIEGSFVRTDFSGSRDVENWYIECKRYSRSIDWPTVYGKLSYAQNHGVDFLLLASNAPISPRCRDEVNRWNAKVSRPKIRTWVGAELEGLLLAHQDICLKYGWTFAQTLHPITFMFLAENLARLVHAAYSRTDGDDYVEPALEAAATLAELLMIRISDAQVGGGFSFSPFDWGGDSFGWLRLENDVTWMVFDRCSLRFLFAFLRLITQSSALSVGERAQGELLVTFVNAHRACLDFEGPLRRFLAWTTLELEALPDAIVLRQRKRPHAGPAPSNS